MLNNRNVKGYLLQTISTSRGYKIMGSYDTFIGDKSTGFEAQLKCFHKLLDEYSIGDEVPVEEFGFPPDCTIADRGGVIGLPDKYRGFGIFVIIRDGKFADLTEDESKVILPVYSKYGDLLEGRGTI